MTEQDFHQQMLAFQEQEFNRFDRLERDANGIKQDINGLKQDIESIRTDMATEVKRCNERFFEFSRDTANRANTLIASAVIAVISGTLLAILKNQ
ncbi:MAG: hypothetical protein EA367_08640 [Leptolyngbya sp. DLM2.Bin15]|nr:MAG: hypothetical protein EA367_08640 [Leptolyngbya sp. DLM2.Bin15]